MVKSITLGKVEQKISWSRWPDRNDIMSHLKQEHRAEWNYYGHYRYIGEEPEFKSLTRYIKTETKTKKPLSPGEDFIVVLGGPFEEVGGIDKSVGGDVQKVGQ